MNKPLNLLIIFGGRSGEHAVSLMSARSVLNAANPSRYHLLQLGITEEGRWLTGPDALTAFENGQHHELQDALLLNENGRVSLYARHATQLQLIGQVDLAFPVLHGSFGEDGTIYEIKNIENMKTTVIKDHAVLTSGTSIEIFTQSFSGNTYSNYPLGFREDKEFDEWLIKLLEKLKHCYQRR